MHSISSFTFIFIILQNQVLGLPFGDEIDENNSTTKMVYWNITMYKNEIEGDMYESEGQSENIYKLSIDQIPIEDYDLSKFQIQLDDQKAPTYQFNQYIQVNNNNNQQEKATTPPPGNGLVGAIESFLKVPLSVPGAAAEQLKNAAQFARTVPELLGINLTMIRNETLTGLRNNPLGTAVQAINNVAFCNPWIAGINVGRCKGFFMAT